MPKRGKMHINISTQEMQVIISVLVAVVLGIMIGLQRERRKLVDKSYGSAGLRTHAIVCLGAALISSAGIVLFTANPLLLAASIMTGVGFIGAGSIISQPNKIKGLTNAASIWISAAIGIAAGLGLYGAAAITTLITILILELRRFERID
jgi:putative Mg2+ transporter-C (MgtC) family protein